MNYDPENFIQEDIDAILRMNPNQKNLRTFCAPDWPKWALDNLEILANHRKKFAVGAKGAYEHAASRCRYYLKHQNFSSWEEASEYEKGVTVACENLEKIMLEEAENL